MYNNDVTDTIILCTPLRDKPKYHTVVKVKEYLKNIIPKLAIVVLSTHNEPLNRITLQM